MILKCFYYHLKWNIFFWTFWAVREQEHQAGSWKPGSCLCVDGFTLEIFGLFRWQSHSQIEGTRFPKVLSRFLTFFDLEDFALLGIVFIITVHWGLLPLLVQWVLSCSTVLTACFSGKLAAVPTSRTTSLPFSCHCMSLSSSLLCSPYDRLMNPRDEVLQHRIRLYLESRLTKKMAD